MPENPTFRKSSYSGARTEGCVEVALDFRKSSYSQPNNNNCVEVADFAGGSAVRDTQHRHLGHVEFTSGEWHAFLEALKHDQL
ncbi:DUF397 domain-containing protein [Nocardiopsis coralliicola]